MILTKPTPRYVDRRIAQFDGNPIFHGADGAVRLAFDQWPQNTNAEQVLMKVVVLNRLYSTSIYNVYPVRDHILRLDMDVRLQAGDTSLVDALATVRFGRKVRYLLSFASKYCAWHQPSHFQMIDSYIEWILWQYQQTYRFAQFRRYELRDYPRFLQLVEQFRLHFGLDKFSRKEIDKFLWIEAQQPG